MMTASAIKREYIDGLFGQVHLLDAPAAGSQRPTLLCLHATAYSAESFRPMMAAFEGDRHVIGVDTPGYGSSDGPLAPIDMTAYADALIDTIQILSPSRAVDVFAYHTGVSIAVEAAVRRKDCIRRIAAVGIPLFDGPDRSEWQRKLLVQHSLEPELDQFEERWDYLVSRRPEGLSLAGGFRNFVDELRAWPRGWFAHQALFAYDFASALRDLTTPLLVINPDAPLAEPSRLSARLAPNAQLIEQPQMRGAIFEQYPKELVALIRDFLDDAEPEPRPPHGTR